MEPSGFLLSAEGGGHPLFVGLVRIDSDGVGLGSVGDTKVQRLSDAPEFDVVVAVDLISF